MLSRRTFLGLLLATPFYGCDKANDSNDVKSKTIGIAYALGGKGDQSYNDAAANALPELAKSFEVKEFSPLMMENFSDALLRLASMKPKIIFCVGYVYDSYVNGLAKQFPDIVFCVLDGNPIGNDNVLGVQFDVKQSSSLAGVVAADNSKIGKIGFVGGSDILPIRPFLEGFTYGAKRYNPAIEVISSYVGAGAEGFTNATRGKDLALGLIESGVDVLFHAAGASGNGVISAAKEKNIYAIGVDVDQAKLAPNNILTSVLKKIDTVIIDLANDFLIHDKRRSGILPLGLKDKAVDITPPLRITDNGKKLLNEIRVEYGA